MLLINFKEVKLNHGLRLKKQIELNLKEKNIFLWKEGDIEEIFGFTEKKERQWQQFRKKLVLEEKELEDIVKHYNSLSQMIDWLDA